MLYFVSHYFSFVTHNRLLNLARHSSKQILTQFTYTCFKIHPELIIFIYTNVQRSMQSISLIFDGLYACSNSLYTVLLTQGNKYSLLVTNETC